MSARFDAARGLILVEAELTGPTASVNLILAVDTGATGTVISHARLLRAGYDPGAVRERVQMTGSGVEFAPRLQVSSLKALDQECTAFAVIAHTLPPTARFDGLLGLDFFRNHRLTMDFRSGTIELE